MSQLSQLPQPTVTPYEMRISRLVVDKLGIKLYDKVSAAIAEIVANSYDADATEVTIAAPMGQYLATKDGSAIVDAGYSISVKDNGHGMCPDDVNRQYLVVGGDRRRDLRRGDISRSFKRKVMGRKGVGKLAPFGICAEMEILCSGGEPIEREGVKYYRTAHLILEREQILNIGSSDAPNELPYKPKNGPFDGEYRLESGMCVTLRKFDRRKVPTIGQFNRQLSQRFGVSSKNWKIKIEDNLKTKNDPESYEEVGSFDIETLTGTRLTLETVVEAGGSSRHMVVDSNGRTLPIPGGFSVDGRFYPVTGWIARSRENYKDDLMAGVRIYCRGKIAAQTSLFNLNSGFTGEYDIRSYLVGQLQADWLDEDEDLIQTDRQDILWSSEIGEAFEAYGQTLVKELGKLSDRPRKEDAWKEFQQATGIEAQVVRAFPREDQAEIRRNSIELAQIFAMTARDADRKDKSHQQEVVQLSLLFGPHLTLDQKLREAAEKKVHSFAAITALMKTARIAELSSFGRVAEKRVNVVNELEKLKDTSDSDERDLQELIARAPWLIDPSWSPITQNQSFTTFKSEFAKYYLERSGEELVYAPNKLSKKRPDFILASEDSRLEVIEIKQPKHQLDKLDAERFIRYFEYLDDFFKNPLNSNLVRMFPYQYRITVVCDGRKPLDYLYSSLIEKKEAEGRIQFINWSSFFHNTQQAHQDFLFEFRRIQSLAISEDDDKGA